MTGVLGVCSQDAAAGLRTLVKYEKVFERVLDLAARRRARSLLDLNLPFMDAYRHERVLAGSAAKTVYNEAVVVRQLVNFAVTRSMVTVDPLKGAKLKKPKPTPQPCWTAEEMDAIIAAADEPQRSVFLLLADTGMRIGELIFLTWDDVDVERRVLHVRAKEGWKPKTGDQRAVPMSVRVRGMLANLPRRGRWVFTAATSGKHSAARQMSPRRLLVSLKRVLQKLGLEGHLHTFRHGFISNALTKGVPEAIVRAWVGHVDPEILKLYTHVMDEASQTAMARLVEANPSTSPTAQEVPPDETGK